MDTVGARLKAARLEAGLSREAVAAACDISFISYNRLETGRTRRLTPETLVTIAKLTGKQPGWFFDTEEATVV